MKKSKTVGQAIAAAESEGRVTGRVQVHDPEYGYIDKPAPAQPLHGVQPPLFDAGPPDVVVIDGLPFPPSVNHYFTNQIIPRVKGQNLGKANAFRILRFPTAEAKTFEQECLLAVSRANPRKLKGFLRCEIVFYPPNKLLRDLDNLPKCLLDGLKKAGVFDDDSQIHDLNAKWAKAADGSILTKPGGKTAIRLTTLGV